MLESMLTLVALTTKSSTYEAYGFIEFFAGYGWVTRCIRNLGVPAASFDLDYLKDVNPDKQNYMDLTSPAGYAYTGFAVINLF